MEINYTLLNERILEMNNVKEIANESVTVLTKKHKNFLNEMKDILSENESLASENAKLQAEIIALRKEHNSEVKELRAEIVELKKECEAKGKSKDYIKKVENELDRLPSTKNHQKKVELVKTFVDWSLSVFGLMDGLPFSQSAKYGYTERNVLIKSMLVKFNREMREEYTNFGEYLKEKYPNGLPAKGIDIGNNVTVKTLDDFVLKYIANS